MDWTAIECNAIELPSYGMMPCGEFEMLYVFSAPELEADTMLPSSFGSGNMVSRHGVEAYLALCLGDAGGAIPSLLFFIAFSFCYGC